MPTKPKGKKTTQKGLPKELQALAEEAEFLDKAEREERVAQKPPFGVMNSEPEAELGKRLQEARETQKLTQGELADRTKSVDKEGKGISRGVISLYELGTNRPSPRELRILCEVLRVTPSYLIYGTEDPFENHMDLGRYGGRARTDPEFYAALTYCFSRLHHHHKIATLDLMMGLLRGWNKGFDTDLNEKADQQFLDIADELRVLLSERKKRTTR